MVLDVEPVADILAAAVDGQRTAFPYVVDEERNQLLGKLVGPVVVRAVGHQRRHAVGVVVGPHEVVGRGLRGRIGTVGVVSRPFGEELLAVGAPSLRTARRIGQRQRAVDLVGRDVVEEPPLPLPVPVLPGGLQQRQRPHDVRAREGERVADRTVHVRLGSQVDHPRYVVCAEEATHPLEVADVAPLEPVVRFALDVPEVLQVARIGQLVEVHDPVIGVFSNEEAHHMAPDEARTSRNQNGSFHSSSGSVWPIWRKQ